MYVTRLAPPLRTSFPGQTYGGSEIQRTAGRELRYVPLKID